MSAVREPRESRLGLVMNGGVSLAVWIGGVTLEVDRLRLASIANETSSAPALDGTAAVYQRLLAILEQKVVVDVIAGASAGGINGILLAAAIANGRPLPNLRETWIGVGDFRSLLRPAAEPNPPSLLQAARVVLPEMRSALDTLYANSQRCPQEYVYLYVSATDLRGYTRQFHDSTNRIFEEREHRRMLRFELGPPARIVDEQDPGQKLVFPWDRAIDLRDP